MSTIASQITGVTIVYSTVCSGANQRKHQPSASLVLWGEIHRSPVEPPHKEPVTRKMFPFDGVIMSPRRREQRRSFNSYAIKQAITCYLSVVGEGSWTSPNTRGTKSSCSKFHGVCMHQISLHSRWNWKHTSGWLTSPIRYGYHSVYAPSQWETALQWNAISHCLGAYTEWSLVENMTSWHKKRFRNVEQTVEMPAAWDAMFHCHASAMYFSCRLNWVSSSRRRGKRPLWSTMGRR